MAAYGSGKLGEQAVPLRDATHMIVIGSDRMMNAVGAARHGVLAPYLNPQHTAIGSINSPMQCMMKEVCAQCLQPQVDPKTGERTVVFSCFNQDQPLDRVDFAALHERLYQNSLQEKLTAAWIDRALRKLKTRPALAIIARDLHATAAASVWVVNAYQLAMIATLLPLAALGDIVGHRRVYAWGLLLFTVASLGCALAWSLPSLAFARVIQGIGASAAMSVNTALIRFSYPPERLGFGVGLNAMIVGTAFAIGPTIASMILSVGPWPWLFAVNVPFGVAALVLAGRTLPPSPPANYRFARVVATLVTVTFAVLVFGLEEAAHGGTLPHVVPLLAVAAVLAVGLLRAQKGHPAPMLPVDLFRRPQFALSSATAIAAFAAQGIAFVALPFFFQHTLGRSVVETGFLMTPWPAITAIMAPIAGGLSDRYPAGILGGIGMAILSVGLLSLVWLPADPGAR